MNKTLTSYLLAASALFTTHLTAASLNKDAWLQQHQNGTGFYIGAQTGAIQSSSHVITNLYSGDIIDDHSSNAGTPYRLALGYNFTHQFGLEMAYSNFGTVNEVQGPSDFSGDNIHTTASVKKSSVELMGLYHIPFGTNWDFYAKLGMAYLQGTLDTSVSTKGSLPWYWPPGVPSNFKQHKVATALNPAYGFGLGRNFFSGRLFVGMDWYRVAAWSGSYNDYLNSMLQSNSMLSLNMIYRFSPYTSVTSNSGFWNKNSSNHFYAGVLAGGNFMSETDSQDTHVTKPTFAGMVDAGYMFNNYVAIEADALSVLAADTPDTSASGIGVMLKVSTPIGKGFDAIVKTGMFLWAGPAYALGVGYNATPHLQVSAQFMSVDTNTGIFSAGEDDSDNIVAAGIEYRL
jgi:hypothetical protein